MGDTANYDHRGIAPRAINQLFGEVGSRMELEFRVSCTYMEIYNERVFDLLTDLSNPDMASDYTVAEEKDGRGTFVRGLTEIEVTNENEALNLLFSGELARTTAQHKLNRKSNRSHSLFTIYVQQRQRSGVSEKVIHSKLHLVDLAGSERLKKTMDSDSDSVTRKESMAINQSLTYLEQCVIKLSQRSSHIPYRQSKLTNILKDCLGANCNTLMLACMWGEESHLEETVSTLRLASRMMRVQNETASIETVDNAALIKKQARIIKALKQELLMHDALVERTGMTYEPYTPEQQHSLANMLERYIDAPEVEEEEIIQVNSYRHMLEICKQFKKMVLTARSEASAAHELALQGGGMVDSMGRPMTGIEGFTEGGDGLADTRIADEFNPESANYVGESDAREGFSLGAAAADSRPIGGVEGASMYATKRSSSPQVAMSPMDRKMGGSIGSPKSDFGVSSLAGTSPTARALFEGYAKGEGNGMYENFVHAKAELKELKQRSKEQGSVINSAKATIDDLQDEIAARKQSRIEMLRKSGLKASETEDIVDEEEFRLMKDLREAKRSYKNGFERLQKMKQAINNAQMKVARIRDEFASSFLHRQNDEADGRDGDADQLDDQEAFDRLETQRVMDEDPDSLAFFHAQKTRRALQTQNSSNIKNIQKNKRIR